MAGIDGKLHRRLLQLSRREEMAGVRCGYSLAKTMWGTSRHIPEKGLQPPQGLCESAQESPLLVDTLVCSFAQQIKTLHLLHAGSCPEC